MAICPALRIDRRSPSALSLAETLFARRMPCSLLVGGIATEGRMISVGAVVTYSKFVRLAVAVEVNVKEADVHVLFVPV